MNIEKAIVVKRYMDKRKKDTAFQINPIERKSLIIKEALQRFQWLDEETAEKIYMNNY